MELRKEQGDSEKHGKRLQWIFPENKMRSLYKIKVFGKMLVRAVIFGFYVLIDILKRGRESVNSKSRGDKIILFGFPLYNKGVQALTFTTIDQMKRKFPDKEVYLFSTKDFFEPNGEKNSFNFNILPWDLDTKIGLLGFPGSLYRKIFKSKIDKEIETQITNILENSFCALDISGYSFSSQWGFPMSVHYILNIMISRRFSIPFYIMPQSFGPFEYNFLQKIILFPLMKFYLSYPKKVFVRERDGLKWIRKFRKKDLEFSYDMVLLNKEYDLKNIYKRKIEFKDMKIYRNSVGIIPNIRVLERADKNILYPIYFSIINKILAEGKKVYLLAHSDTERNVIEELYEHFKENENVNLLTDDLNVFEIVNVIKQFDFIITSRYHSIVHAYKNGVPALSIGWSAKYPELMKDFGQLDYYFDVRDPLIESEILNKLARLTINLKEESKKIIEKYNSLPPLSKVFDIFDQI
jgi:colanic acid/amylovoran biosynthesis protein